MIPVGITSSVFTSQTVINEVQCCCDYRGLLVGVQSKLCSHCNRHGAATRLCGVGQILAWRDGWVSFATEAKPE